MKKSVFVVGVLFSLLILVGCNSAGKVNEGADGVEGMAKEVEVSGLKEPQGLVDGGENGVESQQDEEVVRNTEASVEIIAPVLTMEEVAKHSVEGDCWTVIAGNVYDLSDALAKHPGGKTQLEGCGIDSTELFETRPMGSGTPHSDKAREYLGNYLLGPLTK